VGKNKKSHESTDLPTANSQQLIHR